MTTALKELAELKNLKRGWAGEGSKGPHPQAVKRAVEVVRKAAHYAIDHEREWIEPEVIPQTNGRVELCWRIPPDHKVFIQLWPSDGDGVRLLHNRAGKPTAPKRLGIEGTGWAIGKLLPEFPTKKVNAGCGSKVDPQERVMSHKKWSDDDVREVRELFATGQYAKTDLARKTGIPYDTIVSFLRPGRRPTAGWQDDEEADALQPVNGR